MARVHSLAKRKPATRQNARAPMTPPRFADLPEMVTVEETAAFLRLSRNGAYALVKSGEIQSVKFGKTIRIPKAALLVK